MPRSCKEESSKQGFSQEFSDRILGPQANLPENYMEQDGASFVLGASPEKKILLRPLPLNSRFPELSFQIKETEKDIRQLLLIS